MYINIIKQTVCSVHEYSETNCTMYMNILKLTVYMYLHISIKSVDITHRFIKITDRTLDFKIWMKLVHNNPEAEAQRSFAQLA